MLTMSEDHDTALTALRDGAAGYLVKGAGPERVEHAAARRRRRRRRPRPRPRRRRQRAGPGPSPLRLAARSRSSPSASSTCSGWSPRGSTTTPSPGGSCSARRPCATTCRTSSPRSTPPTARRPSCWPAASASATVIWARSSTSGSGRVRSHLSGTNAPVLGALRPARRARRRRRRPSTGTDARAPCARVLRLGRGAEARLAVPAVDPHRRQPDARAGSWSWYSDSATCSSWLPVPMPRPATAASRASKLAGAGLYEPTSSAVTMASNCTPRRSLLAANDWRSTFDRMTSAKRSCSRASASAESGNAGHRGTDAPNVCRSSAVVPRRSDRRCGRARRPSTSG